MQERIDQQDIYDLFGGTIPVAAMTLIAQMSPETTVESARLQLAAMAKLWRSLECSLIEPYNLRPFEHAGGGLIQHHGSRGAQWLCVVDDRIAAEMTMLLNIGHEKYIVDMPAEAREALIKQRS